MEVSEILQRPFFYSLGMLERSTLPLSYNSPLLKKAALYALQFFQAITATCLLAMTTPFAALGTVFQISGGLIFKQEDPKAAPDKISLPADFKMGVSDSFFQSCGLGLSSKKMKDGVSDWNHWIHGSFPNGEAHLEGKPDLSKIFINYLDNPNLVIQKLKEIGATTYRFSLERSVLEPIEGKFDKSYIQKYRRFIEKLKANGIRPVLTLHHFVNPSWFLQKGGFEKEENIEGFVRYSEKMFDAFGDVVKHWVTINEPAIYAFQGYVGGVYPPGKSDLSLAGKVMKNLLVSHCRVYEKVKKRHHSLQIGISHNWLRFQPYSSYNPIERLTCYYLSEITHNAVIRFFQTGKFSLQIPFIANVQHEEVTAPNDLDFIGVQYYTKPLLKIEPFSAGSTHYPGGKMTKQGGRYYPEGLEEVLDEAATLKKPIWVTETGCDMDQADYFQKVFSIMSKAIAKGVPLACALLWTLRSNLEWDRGSKVQFGLCDSKFKAQPVVKQVVRPIFRRMHPLVA